MPSRESHLLAEPVPGQRCSGRCGSRRQCGGFGGLQMAQQARARGLDRASSKSAPLLRRKRTARHQRSDPQLLAPLRQRPVPALFPPLGQQRRAHRAKLQTKGRRQTHIRFIVRWPRQAAVQQVRAKQHGAAGPAQLHHIDGAQGRLAGRTRRAAAHHMPHVMGAAHPLLQPGVVAICARRQHRIWQGLAAGVREPGGVAMAEALCRQSEQLRLRRPIPPVALRHQGGDGGVGPQGGASRIRGWGGVAAGEQIKTVGEIARVFHQLCQVGRQVQQLTAEGGVHREAAVAATLQWA
jgi:hypothetical protein